MGALRLWLAICVYIEHKGLWGVPRDDWPLTGIVAVKTFYMISGFLMQFVIAEKYSKLGRGWKVAFWKSRALRVYPLYWLTLLASIVFTCVMRIYPHYYPGFSFADQGLPYDIRHYRLVADQTDILPRLLYVFGHLFIVGIDVSEQFVFDLAQWKFAWWSSVPFLHILWGPNFFLIPQAWSLAVELWFYLLAPFILCRNTITVMALSAASFWLYLHIGEVGLRADSVIFSQLYFFLAGALASRFYLRYVRTSERFARAGIYAGIPLLAYSVIFRQMHGDYVEDGFYVTAALALPFLFHTFSRSRIDTFLGDLSYPVYLIHILVFPVVATFIHNISILVIAPLLMMLVAAALVIFVERPMDRLRHRAFLKATIVTEKGVICSKEGQA